MFVFLIRPWIWLLEHRRTFLKDNFQCTPEVRSQHLGGVSLSDLLEKIRGEIAGLMDWHYEEEEEEEDLNQGSPTPEAKGGKRKKSGGRWLMRRMPWETPEPGHDSSPTPGDYQVPRDAIDASFRFIMHYHFSHQSWALHTLLVVGRAVAEMRA